MNVVWVCRECRGRGVMLSVPAVGSNSQYIRYWLSAVSACGYYIVLSAVSAGGHYIVIVSIHGAGGQLSVHVSIIIYKC